MGPHGVAAESAGRRHVRTSADVLALLAVTSWGLSYGLTKLAFREWRPLVFTGTRFLAMAAIALVVLAAQRRLGAVLGADRTRFALGGLFGFTLYQLGFTLGLDRTSALRLDPATHDRAALLPALPVARRRRIGAPQPMGGRRPRDGWASCLFMSRNLGRACALTEARLGDLLSLGAAASFALYGIVNKPLASRYPASTVLAGTLLVGSLPLVPLGLVGLGRDSRGARSRSLGWAIWIYAVDPPHLPGLHVVDGGDRAPRRRGHRAVRAAGPRRRRALRARRLGETLSFVSAVGAVVALLGLALSRDWLPSRRRRMPGAESARLSIGRAIRPCSTQATRSGSLASSAMTRATMPTADRAGRASLRRHPRQDPVPGPGGRPWPPTSSPTSSHRSRALRRVPASRPGDGRAVRWPLPGPGRCPRDPGGQLAATPAGRARVPEPRARRARWYDSEEYREPRRSGIAASRTNAILVEGVYGCSRPRTSPSATTARSPPSRSIAPSTGTR